MGTMGIRLCASCSQVRFIDVTVSSTVRESSERCANWFPVFPDARDCPYYGYEPGSDADQRGALM